MPSRSQLLACWLTRSLASAVKLARSLATWISTSSHSTCETPSCQAEPKGRLLLGSPIGPDANKNNKESRPQQTMKKLVNERSILFTKIWLTIAFNKLKTLTIHTSCFFIFPSLSFHYSCSFLNKAHFFCRTVASVCDKVLSLSSRNTLLSWRCLLRQNFKCALT